MRVERYIRPIGGPRRTIAAALSLGVLGAIVAGGVGDASPPVSRRALPVQIRLSPQGRIDLLDGGRLPLRLAASRAQRVRLVASLQPAGSPALALAAPRSVNLRPGRPRNLSLPLTPAARNALAGCPAAHIVVAATSPRFARPRSAVAPLLLEPPMCGRFFSPSTFWNTALPADAPLDPQSAAISAELQREVDAGFRSGPAPTINTTEYTPPVYTVSTRQPHVTVHLDRPPGAAPELASAFASVPLPDGARPSAGSDADLVVWQPGTDTLWEFWQLKRRDDGWHAVWGGRLTGVSRGPGVFTAPHADWGTSASSLPLAGGLITPRELASGSIDHALAIGIPMARAGVFSSPAQRTDGVSSCAHAIPEGARFRLDPTLDIGSLGLAPAVAAIARAAQRYGIIVRDQSAAVAFFAQNTVSLPSDPYPALFGGQQPWDLLRAFPWAHLQLVQMHLVAAQGGRPPPPLQPVQGLIGGCR